MTIQTESLSRPDTRTDQYRRVFQRYWTLCKVSFQERMEYRWNTFFFLLITLIPALMAVLLWRAVYGQKADHSAFRTITTYYVVATFWSWRIADFHWEVMWNIREGRMANDLLRPLSYPAKLFWYEAGGRSWSTLLTTPVFILVGFLLGNNFQAPSSPWPWLLMILAGLIAFVLNYFMTAALGLITVWQNQPEGFFALWGAVSRALGGAVVPLALMPDGLGNWLQWLPFAYIYSLPTRIFLGLDGGQILQGLAVQLVWLALAIVIFRWAWRKAVRRYEVFEG